MSDSETAASRTATGRGVLSPRRLAWLLPGCLCLVAVLMVHHPLILSGFTRAQMNPGDPRLINFCLEHAYRILTGAPHAANIWDMPFFYPENNVGAYADILIALSPPYLLFRLVGISPDLSFHLWMIVLTLLNFWVFYYFLRTCFGLDVLPAAVGAALFAAGAPRTNFLDHPQLTCHVFLVLALIGLHRLFTTPAPDAEKRLTRPWWQTAGWLALLFGSGVAQCFAGFYNAFFMLMFLLVVLTPVLLMPTLRRRLAEVFIQQWPTLLVLTGLAIVLLLPLVRHYSAVAEQQGMRSWPEVSSMLPRPQSWFYMGDGSWLYRGLAGSQTFTELPARNEHQIGFGLLTVVVTGIGLFQERRRAGVKLLTIALVFGVVGTTFWWDNYSLWEIIFDELPGGQAVRAVARLALLLLIPMAVGVACALQHYRPQRRWLGVLLGLVCLLEQGVTTPTYDRAAVQRSVAEIVARIDPRYRAFYVTRKGATDRNYKVNVDAMWAAIAAGVPTVNGHSGWHPPGQTRLYDSTYQQSADAAKIEIALRNWAVRHGLRRQDIQWIQLEGDSP